MTRHMDHIRNIGKMAHVDAGKTTLTERILFNAGRIHMLCDIHTGNTEMDSRAVEQAHGIIISATATVLEWRGCGITLIDTTEHPDFTIEVERSLPVLDGAVAVFSTVSGVEPQSETVWRQADRYGTPRQAFVNKMDSLGVAYDDCVAQLCDQLGAVSLMLHLPIGPEDRCRGVVDLVTRQELLWAELSEPTVSHVPAMRAAAAELEAASQWQDWAARDGGPEILAFNGFSNSQGVLKFDAQIPDCAVHLGMTKQKLNRPQVAGLFVDLGHLCSPHRMRAICARF